MTVFHAGEDTIRVQRPYNSPAEYGKWLVRPADRPDEPLVPQSDPKERNAMEIRQFRVVIRTSNFERATKFYGSALGLPQLQSWDRENDRGAVFQAGTSVLEVVGPPASEDPRQNDERFNPQGPHIRAAFVFEVASAQQAYDEIYFREKNIPGGLQKDDHGRMTFVTHDPDNFRIVFREP
jgi:catechol 2,3-dioxygenase-like lactoylglutathione lyase family enzyme